MEIFSEKLKRMQAEEPKEIEKKEGEYEWAFTNVIPTYRNGKIAKFNCSLSAATLAEMFSEGWIEYVPDIQRGERINKRGEAIPIFRASKIKEILEGMLEDTLHGGTIVLNIDPSNKIQYDEDKRKLNGTGKLAIIDGQHRIRAVVRWFKLFKRGRVVQDPNEWEIPVTIEIQDMLGAADIFAEYALKPLKISKVRAEFLNVKDYSNVIVRKLIKNSELRDKVECVSTIAKGKNIVTFGILTKALNTYVKPKTQNEADEITVQLIDYVNKLVNVFADIMGNVDIIQREALRKKYLTIEPMFWDAYIALFAELRGRDDIVNKLQKLNSEVKVVNWRGKFLSRENPIWVANIMINGRVVNKKSTAKFVVNTIKEFVMENNPPEAK